MPGLSGRALVRELQRLRPGIRAPYVSGHTRDAIVHRGVLDEGVQFLSKPFTPATLLERVGQVLRASA
jgi:DNA-binding response OmpR family regulator